MCVCFNKPCRNNYRSTCQLDSTPTWAFSTPHPVCPLPNVTLTDHMFNRSGWQLQFPNCVNTLHSPPTAVRSTSLWGLSPPQMSKLIQKRNNWCRVTQLRSKQGVQRHRTCGGYFFKKNIYLLLWGDAHACGGRKQPLGASFLYNFRS